MKKILLAVPALAILLSLTGCPGNFEPRPPSDPAVGQTGFVSLRFGASAGRTLLPDDFAFEAYEVTFTRVGGDANGEVRAFPRGDRLYYYELSSGYWRLDVDVFFSAAPDAQRVAYGSADVEIRGGEITDVTVYLTFVSSDIPGRGTFVWTIDAAANVTGPIAQTGIILERLDGQNAGEIYLLFHPDLAGGSKEIDAGFYLITASMEIDPITPLYVNIGGVYEYFPGRFTGARRAVWTDIMHIHPGQTTTLDHTFYPRHFFYDITQVWLFGHMTGWDSTDLGNNKAMTEQPDRTFSWTGGINARPDGAPNYFRFGLTDTSGWTSDRWNGAWFVPVSGPGDYRSVALGETVDMGFLPLHHENQAAVNDGTWRLNSVGSHRIVLDPINRTFTVEHLGVVGSVEIAPETATVVRGESRAFTATVDAPLGVSDAVIWEVLGANKPATVYRPYGTRIVLDPADSHAATLHVADDEWAATLTVRVVSAIDHTRHATAAVTLTGDIAVNEVWLVGGMVGDGWDLPGEPMTRNIVDGTFTWSGIVTAGDTFRFNLSETSAFNAAGSWFAPAENNTPVYVGGSVPMTRNNAHTGNAWTVPQAGLYRFTVDPITEMLHVEREGVPVDAVWLLGHMAEDHWTLPGEPMTRNTVDGTFTWSGDVAEGNTFRFNLDIATTGWTNGTWFAPPGGNVDAVLGINPIARRVNPTINSGDAWRITRDGWYVFTVDPAAETLYIERPITVTEVTVAGPDRISAGTSETFTATAHGINADADTFTWSIEGTGFATGTTIDQAGVLTVHADEMAPSLTIRATSVTNSSEYDELTVTVDRPADGLFLQMDPRGPQSAVRGTNLPFTATVTVVPPGAGLPTAVTWYLDGHRRAGTVLNYTVDPLLRIHTATLVIANDEIAEALTVTVRSVYDNTIYDTATVTLTGPIAVNEAWLVGSMVAGWDAFPGTPLVMNADGTFTWSGVVTAGDTFRINLYSETAGWSDGSWFAPQVDGTYLVIGYNDMTRFDPPHVGSGRAWRIRDAGYYTITVNPGTGMLYVEREGVPVDYVWLVGDMATGGWTHPGQLMTRNTVDGTFTWAGDVAANNHFRFNLSNATTGWNNGTWFVPIGGEDSTADLGSNDMVRLVNPLSSSFAWGITQSGWYEFTVCPRTETLHVARPVVVENITIAAPPAQLRAGHAYEFTVTLTGRNIEGADITVTWTVSGGGAGTGFVGNILTVAAGDVGSTLVITASALGQSSAPVSIPTVNPADFNEATINLTVQDRGAGLAIYDMPTGTLALSISGAGGLPTLITFTVRDPQAGHTYEWIVNGQRRPAEWSGDSITINAGDPGIGIGHHTVRLVVTINGVPWSLPQSLNFTVER